MNSTTEWFHQQHVVFQAFIAGTFTWAVTALGAAVVFGFFRVQRKFLDAMLGFAGGVMLAASYWSLLAPSIEISRNQGWPGWFPPAVGFLAGGGFLFLLDQTLPHLHIGLSPDQSEGPKTTWRRSVLLVSAITIHNIPEGLAVGVAFGSLGGDIESATLGSAVALAIGIGIQNFPEGLAVAMPLRGEGVSRLRCWWWGQASALVEPVAAVVGAAIVVYSAPVLPFALAFAAGAMVYVVVEELIPETQQEGNDDLATLCLMTGFTVMMVLDVALG